MIPDEEIATVLRRINGGEESAFAAMYDAYADRVFRLLMKLTSGRRDVAEEVFQITMIRLARRRLPVVSEEKEWWAWLARVTRNAWIDFLRAESRRRNREEAYLRETEAQSVKKGEREWHADREAMLAEAMALLSEDERKLIESRYLGQLSIGRLAAQLQVSYQSVESRLGRIRKKLRKIILARKK